MPIHARKSQKLVTIVTQTCFPMPWKQLLFLHGPNCYHLHQSCPNSPTLLQIDSGSRIWCPHALWLFLAIWVGEINSESSFRNVWIVLLFDKNNFSRLMLFRGFVVEWFFKLQQSLWLFGGIRRHDIIWSHELWQLA